jgi:hypothetical protein
VTLRDRFLFSGDDDAFLDIDSITVNLMASAPVGGLGARVPHGGAMENSHGEKSLVNCVFFFFGKML